MKIYEVRITNASRDAGFERDTRPLPAELNRWLRKNVGGSCVGQGATEVMILEVQAPDRECFEPLIRAFADAYRWGANVAIVVHDKIISGLTAGQAELAHAFLIEPTKLTKAFFWSVPAGRLLVSNGLGGPGLTPSYAGYVAENLSERSAQWQEIVAARADQRMCCVFPSEAAYQAWEAERWDSLPGGER